MKRETIDTIFDGIEDVIGIFGRGTTVAMTALELYNRWRDEWGTMRNKFMPDQEVTAADVEALRALLPKPFEPVDDEAGDDGGDGVG